MHHFKHRRIATLSRTIVKPGFCPSSFASVLAQAGQIHCLVQRADHKTESLYFDPLITFRIDDHVLRITPAEGGEQMCIARPLDDLKEILESYKNQSRDGLRSESGYVGYIGYDCIRYLESISLPQQKSSEPGAFVFVYGAAVTLEPSSGLVRIDTSVFISPLDSDAEVSAKLLAKLDALEMRLRESFLNVSKASLQNLEPLFHEPTSDAFAKTFETIQEHIQDGDIFQCVVSRRFEIKNTKAPYETYESLKAQNPSPYHFCLSTPDFDLIGASPEPFVKVSNGIASTFPIAGTRPRGQTAAQDMELARELRCDPKEVAEHTMLVDLARNDLGRVSEPGTVRVDDLMHIEKYSRVMHLVSRVSGTLISDCTPLQAFFACFPAGTLTGAPKIRAMQIISEVETIRRGAYGGALVLSQFGGDFDSCIVIRSAVIANKIATVQAGAGIVSDSNATSEFQEIHFKSLAMRSVLQENFELCEVAP